MSVGVIGNPQTEWAQQAIDAKAAQMNLGAPSSDLQSIDFYTYMQSFQSGSDVYWTLQTGAFEVHGEIKRKYAQWGGASGFLGIPVTDESGTPDGIGRFNHFLNGGSIYWTPQTGPMTVSGAIRDKWASQGWEQGPVGYPVTDQVRWRTIDPSVDQFIAWNKFQNGAIVTTKNVTDFAGLAHITPDQLQYLVHRAVDNAIHQLPDNIGLYPEILTTGVTDWGYDFEASTDRTVSYKLHGFHDNGVLGDAEFHFWFALKFSLSVDPTSFTDPWFRSLQVELVPGSVGIDVDGISGWFANEAEYKQKIEAGFAAHANIRSFPVTTYLDQSQPAPPHDQVNLIVIDLITTAAGGIDFLITPEPPFAGTDGSWVPLIQSKLDDFVSNF